MWAFLAVTVPLVLIPGASTAVVLRNSIAGRIRAGVETAVGVNAGSACYGLLTAFGVAFALQRWPMTWSVLRFAGVIYLAWLGMQSLVRALGPAPHSSPAPTPQDTIHLSMRSHTEIVRNVREGFITNVLNPSIAAFYFVIVPQFVPRGTPAARGVLTLTAVHVALAATWHVVWAMAGGALARTLSAGTPRRALDLAAGLALVALAIKLASS